jgi:hypothetical protein
MGSIIYYSNYCEPSKRLLQTLAKTRLKEEAHFICIDNRYKDSQQRTLIELNGQHLVLPLKVTRVPCLYLIDRDTAVFGDDIYKYFSPSEAAVNYSETSGNGEPECFHNNMLSMSDAYSFWDTNAEDLETKGNGGMRQSHSFVAVDQFCTIQTPPEDYQPDKVKANSLEELKSQREMQIPSSQPRT